MEDKDLLEEKRLVVMLDINIHCEVKKRAATQNVSIKRWIEQAIMDKIRKEIELGFE